MPFFQEVVECLVEEAQADVNQRNGQYDDFALLIASKNGHSQVVMYLLSHGAQADAKNNVGSTSLDWARESGHQDIIRVLEDAANKHTDQVERREEDELSPLSIAAQRGELVNSPCVCNFPLTQKIFLFFVCGEAQTMEQSMLLFFLLLGLLSLSFFFTIENTLRNNIFR